MQNLPKIDLIPKTKMFNIHLIEDKLTNLKNPKTVTIEHKTIIITKITQKKLKTLLKNNRSNRRWRLFETKIRK